MNSKSTPHLGRINHVIFVVWKKHIAKEAELFFVGFRSADGIRDAQISVTLLLHLSFCQFWRHIGCWCTICDGVAGVNLRRFTLLIQHQYQTVSSETQSPVVGIGAEKARSVHPRSGRCSTRESCKREFSLITLRHHYVSRIDETATAVCSSVFTFHNEQRKSKPYAASTATASGDSLLPYRAIRSACWYYCSELQIFLGHKSCSLSLWFLRYRSYEGNYTVFSLHGNYNALAPARNLQKRCVYGCSTLKKGACLGAHVLVCTILPAGSWMFSHSIVKHGEILLFSNLKLCPWMYLCLCDYMFFRGDQLKEWRVKKRRRQDRVKQIND